MRGALPRDMLDRSGTADGGTILFPPPSAAATLYLGPVMHARLKPFGHRFSYDVASLLVDLDQLQALSRCSPLISHNRFNLFSIHDRDLGAGDGGSVRAHIDGLTDRAGLARAARVLVLTYPRVLGYVFNPLSVYFAYASDDRLVAAIYEVRNTFGDRHTYVAPVRAGQLGSEGLKQEQDKLFHVSPFLDLAMRYHFRVRPPGETVAIRILETDRDGPILAATFHGRQRRLTSGALTGVFFRLPLLPLKIIGGIHWEALKLWLKGARYHPRPEPAATASLTVGHSPERSGAGGLG